MEQEIFRTLNAGTKFDKRSCGDAWELFRTGKRSKRSSDISASGSVACDVPLSLDFFGSNEEKEDEVLQGYSHSSEQVHASHDKKRKYDAEQSKNLGTKDKRQRKKRKGKSREETITSSSSAAKGQVRLLVRRNANDDDDDFDSVEPTTSGASKEHNMKMTAQENAIASLRGRMGIRVKGDCVAPPCATFDDMQLGNRIRDTILQNVEKSEYKEPTPIQMQAIPIMLDGRDILAAAPTGSGKTLAFLIPTLVFVEEALSKRKKKKKKKKKKKRKGREKDADGEEDGVDSKSVEVSRGSPSALILAPTRELAAQICREAVRMSRGRSLQIRQLTKANAESMRKISVDLLIATPLRLVHLAREAKVCLKTVKLLVMDEADKLFELGFLEQVDEILALCNSKLQRALFSATLPEGVEDLARTILMNPVRVVVGTRNACNASIEQSLKFVGREDGKLLALRQFVAEGLKPPVIIFVQSKERAKELFRELAYDGLNIDTLHADRTALQRDAAVQGFRSGRIWVLIATDILGRGIDFKGIKTVINYDFPQSATSYVHRIGRTGRAGRVGRAITLFTEQDMPMLRSIANVMRLSGCDVPAWMLQMKKLNRRQRKRIERSAPKRYRISTTSWHSLHKASKRRSMIEHSKRKASSPASPGGPREKTKAAS
eukprot:g2721.t1